MSVNATKSTYDNYINDWLRVRHVFNGNKAIIQNAKNYIDPLVEQSDPDYWKMIKRGVFENFTEATAKGISGLIFAKDPQIELTPNLETLRENIDMDDNSIIDLSQNLVNELMEVGRCGLLVDTPNINTEGMTKTQTDALNIRAFAKLYKTENIINWRYETINSVNKLSLLVLAETYEDYINEFEAVTKDQYRVYSLIDNVCYVRVFRMEDKQVVLSLDAKPIKVNGSTIDYIPFIPLTYKDISIEPVKPPLMDIADVNLAYYRLSVDRNEALHYVIPVRYGRGIQLQKDEKVKFGYSDTPIFSNPQAEIMISEYQGQGLAPLENQLNDYKTTMAAMGARLLVADSNAQVSENTMQMKTAGYRATIMQIANTASRGLTQALKIIAEWEKENPDKIKIELNTDYNLSEMDAPTITALVTSWQTGAIRQEDMFKKLQKGEVIDSEVTFEDYQATIENNLTLDTAIIK